MGAAIGIAIVALIPMLFAWFEPREPALPYAKRDWLLIANFENQTSEPNLDQALMTALTVSMEQSTFVNVFPRTRVATTIERMKMPADSPIDEPLAREICLREGLRALLAPSITRTGREYAVAARLINPNSGDTVRAYLIRAADENHILQSLQKLAERLRRDLGESIKDIDANNQPLAQVTTPVLAALQQYSKGLDDWHHARYEDASRQFGAAITADPEFAMAYALLGKLNYSNVYNRPDLGAQYFQRAIALSVRTTNRERQSIAADFAAFRGHVEEARQLYAAYAVVYPDDLGMHLRMAALLDNAALHSEAAAAYRAALAINPKAATTRFNYAVALGNAGDLKSALREIESALELDPKLIKEYSIGYTYAFMLFGGGMEDRAEELLTQLLAEPDQKLRALRGLGLIDMYHGKYGAAAQHFREVIDLPNTSPDANLTRARNYGYLVAISAARGNRKDALQSVDKAAASFDAHGSVPIEFRARLAIAAARLSNIPAAQRQLDRIAADADSLRPRDRAIVKIVQGEIELARGHAAAAVELFQAANGEQPTYEPSLALDRLARAREANGNRDEAIDLFRKLIALRGEWLGWEAQEVWQMAHYQLARLYHGRGDDTLAKEALDPLLTAWSNADSDLPTASAANKLQSEIAKNR